MMQIKFTKEQEARINDALTESVINCMLDDYDNVVYDVVERILASKEMQKKLESAIHKALDENALVNAILSGKMVLKK